MPYGVNVAGGAAADCVLLIERSGLRPYTLDHALLPYPKRPSVGDPSDETVLAVVGRVSELDHVGALANNELVEPWCP